MVKYYISWDKELEGMLFIAQNNPGVANGYVFIVFINFCCCLFIYLVIAPSC